jgi:hypothetical protein
MRRRRASYAEAAGYRGVMEQLYRMAAQQGHPHPESRAGEGEGGDGGEYATPYGSSASPAGEGNARSPAGGAGSVQTGSHQQPRAVAIPDPSIFAPITVELDANTVASVRRCRNGYTLDVTFTATPVGVVLTHNVVSGTEPGSYGEGIVGPGDELLRIGIHNVPRGPPPKKPRRAIPGQRRRWRAPTASEVRCTDAVCLCCYCGASGVGFLRLQQLLLRGFAQQPLYSSRKIRSGLALHGCFHCASALPRVEFPFVCSSCKRL